MDVSQSGIAVVAYPAPKLSAGMAMVESHLALASTALAMRRFGASSQRELDARFSPRLSDAALRVFAFSIFAVIVSRVGEIFLSVFAAVAQPVLSVLFAPLFFGKIDGQHPRSSFAGTGLGSGSAVQGRFAPAMIAQQLVLCAQTS